MLRLIPSPASHHVLKPRPSVAPKKVDIKAKDKKTVAPLQDKEISNMTEKEKREIANKMAIHQFLITERLAEALNGGKDSVDIEKFILRENIKGLEYL